METIGIIAVATLALLAVLAFIVSFRKKDSDTAMEVSTSQSLSRRETRAASKELEAQASSAVSAIDPPPAAPEVYIPPDEETLGIKRRAFLGGSIVGLSAFGLGGIGVAAIKTLMPIGSGGFGAKITVGKVTDIKDSIESSEGFFYFPAGRMWITEYPESALTKAQANYGFYDQVSQGLESGVVALFQTCPHLGCRVPECATSQWFECPCHGSQYNRVGEKKGGPAPRGMDRFPMTVNAKGELEVDTGNVIAGPAIGVNTTGQEAEGPNCLSEGGGH